MKKNQPIELGMVIDDVIMFVRIAVYKDMNDMGNEDSDRGEDVDKTNEEEINDNDIEEEDIVDSDGEITDSQKLVRTSVVSPNKNKSEKVKYRRILMMIFRRIGNVLDSFALFFMDHLWINATDCLSSR